MTEKRQNQFPWDIGVEPTDNAGLAGEPGGLLFNEEFREGRGNYDPYALYVKPTGRSQTSMPGFQYLDASWRSWVPVGPSDVYLGGPCAIDTNRGAGVVLPLVSPPTGVTYAWAGATKRVAIPTSFAGEPEYFMDLFARSGLLALSLNPLDAPYAAYGGIIVALADLQDKTDGPFIHIGWGATDPDNPTLRPVISKWSDASTIVESVEVQRGSFESTLRVMLNVEFDGDALLELGLAYAFDGETRGEGWRLFAQDPFLIEDEGGAHAVLTIGIASTGFNNDVVANATGSWTDFIRLYGPYEEPDDALLRTTGGRNWPGG